MPKLTLDLTNPLAYATPWAGSISDPDGRLTASSVPTGGLSLSYVGTSSGSGEPPFGGLGINLQSRGQGSASGVVSLAALPADALITQLRVTALAGASGAHSTFRFNYITGPDAPIGGYTANLNTGALVKMSAPEANLAVNTPDSDTTVASGYPGLVVTGQSDVTTSATPSTKTTVLASVSKVSFISGVLDTVTASIGDASADAVSVMGSNGGAPYQRVVQSDQTISGGLVFTYLTYELTYTSATVNYTLSPTSGPEAGGTAVSITGASGLTGASVVLFGGVPATSVVVVNDGRVDALSPPGTGVVDVTVVVGPVTHSVTPSFTYVPIPTITTTSLPAGVIGVAYSQPVNATGGTPPYVFSLLSGTLPAGLSLAASGLISGTPSGPQALSTFTVRVTDAFLQTDDQLLTIQVNGPPTITTTSLPNGTIGTAYSQTVAAIAGTPPYVFTLLSGTLPAGLSLATSGAITGTPSGPSALSSFTVLVTDAVLLTDDQPLSIRVCPVIGISPASPPNGTIGSPYSQTMSATGSAATPYAWSVVSGTLPPGLALSGGGVLAGTPTTAGGYAFTVLAADTNGCSVTQACSLSVACPTIAIAPGSPLPNGTASYAYTQTLAASGSAATPYTWSLVGGALPTGVALSSDGVLSGVPSSVGGHAFTVRAADINGCLATQVYALTVVCPVISVSSLQPIQTGFTGIPYSRTFVATGGALPYTWSVTSGALPTGLTLASDGALTGTPTTIGTFAFAVRAVDGNGCASTVAAYSIAIQGVLTMPGFPVYSGKFIAFTNGAPLFQPLAGGRVETYENRTSTPYPTFTDGSLLVENSNPVILDSAGRASIFIPDRSVMTYTFVVRDSAGVIVYTENDISAPAVPPAASTAGLGIVPTGSILPYGGEQTPGAVTALALLGYLFCDGASYSNAPAPTGYAALFDVIGYKYGGSSGSFAVPDYRGRTVLGVAAAGPAPIVCGASGGQFDHVHTGPSHTHTAPAHKHGMEHTHTVSRKWTPGTSGPNGPTFTDFLLTADGTVGAIHTPNNDQTSGISSEILTGDPSISLVTTFGGEGNTGTGNPPYLTATFIIKT